MCRKTNYQEGKGMQFTRTSQLTGVEHTMEVNCTQEQWNEYLGGHKLIQNIMPDVPAEQREFLMTGITPDEWDTYVGDGDED
jgi:hypothetical protein